MRRPVRHKYHAQPTYVGDRRFDSKAEAIRAAELGLLVRGGLVVELEYQPRFELGCPENVYVADFRIRHADGRVEVEDVKGFETPVFKRNRKLWAKYGRGDLVVLKRKRNGWQRETIPGGADHADDSDHA